MPNRIHTKYYAAKAVMERIDARYSARNKSENYVGRIASATRPLVGKLKALADQIDAPNPALTDAGNFEKVASNAEALYRSAKPVLNTINSIQTDGQRSLNAEADTRLKLGTAGPHENLILQRVVNSSKSDVHTAMIDAMKSGDSEVFGAMLRANPFLTGLTKEETQRLRHDYLKLHAPDIVKGLETLEEVASAARMIGDLTTEVKRYLVDPQRVAEIRAGIEAANAAEKAFNNPQSET